MPGSSTLNTDMHYVPQCLLRGFEISPGSDQVYAYAKADDRIFPVGIRNVACERDFYTINNSDALDRVMNRADGELGSLLTAIRDRESIFWLSAEQKTMLAGFTILQSLRTRSKLEQWKHLGKEILDALERKGEQLKDRSNFELDADLERESYLGDIVPSTLEYLPTFLQKDMLLFKTEDSSPFWISDNPVALANNVNRGDGIRGTLGFSVRGIEVYLPISSRLSIAFLCRSIGQTFEILDADMKECGFISERAHRFLLALRTGRPFRLCKDETLNQNSLQVANAERFVFSCQSDYSEAVAMLQNAPHLREGPRLRAR